MTLYYYMYRSWQDCCRRGENRSWPSVSVESVDSEYWCFNNAIVYAFIMRLTVQNVQRSTFKLNILYNSYVSVNTVRFAFLQCYCEWILIFYVAKEFLGRFQTGREPSVTPLRYQVLLFRGTFFNLNSNITFISFLHCMPRITGEDECHNFSKALKTSQMLLF